MQEENVQHGLLLFLKCGVFNTMSIFFWILIGLLINMFIGAVVCVTIDDKEEHLYHWYKECPLPIFGKPLILSCWPIILYFYFIQND